MSEGGKFYIKVNEDDQKDEKENIDIFFHRKIMYYTLVSLIDQYSFVNKKGKK